MHYWQTQKSYEGMTFEFSNDHEAATLTGSEFFQHDVVDLLMCNYSVWFR